MKWALIGTGGLLAAISEWLLFQLWGIHWASLDPGRQTAQSILVIGFGAIAAALAVGALGDWLILKGASRIGQPT